MKPKLALARAEIAHCLEAIRDVFVPGTDPRITLIVRVNDTDEGNLILTDDDLEKAARAIQVMKDRPHG